MRIYRFCSSVRARGLLHFNTIVSKELICKELGFSLEIHVTIFQQNSGVFSIHSCFSNRVLIKIHIRKGEHYIKMPSGSIEVDKSEKKINAVLK